MAQAPLYRGNVQLPATGGAVRINPASVALPDGARLLDTVTGLATDFAQQRDKARLAADLSRLNHAGLTRLNDLQLDAENDSDPRTVEARFNTQATAIYEELASSTQDERVRNLFTREFQTAQEARRVAVARKAFAREADGERARLDAEGFDYAQMAAMAGSGPDRDQAVRLYQGSVAAAAMAGWIDPTDAQKRLQKFGGDIDEADARTLIAKDPATAMDRLADPKAFRNLDEVRRARLTDTATRRFEADLARREADERRAEVAAEKAQRLQGDTLLKGAYERAASGSLTVAEAQQIGRHPGVAPSEAKGLLELAKGGGADRDDNDTLVRLNGDLEAPGFLADAARALRDGKLKQATYLSLTGKHREAVSDDRPESPFKAGREYLQTTLKATGGLFGPMGQSAFNRLPADAAMEYDAWAEQNPTASRGDVNAFVLDLRKRYEVQAVGSLRILAPLPRGLADRNAVDAAAIDRADAALRQAFKAGELSATQAELEIERLADWRGILATEQQAAPGAGRPANAPGARGVTPAPRSNPGAKK